MFKQVFIYVVSMLLVHAIVNFFKRKEKEYGRPNTKYEQKIIDRQMKEFLETNPDHSFFKDNPKYVEKYLDEIDLSELNLHK